MGYRDYKSKTGPSLWNTSNPLVMLVILLAMFFILLNFLKSIYTFSAIPEEAFYRNIYQWFAMPADPSKLAFRPWTILTMQFSEVKLFVAISNIFWLWLFAHLIQDLILSGDIFFLNFLMLFQFLPGRNLIKSSLLKELLFFGILLE